MKHSILTKCIASLLAVLLGYSMISVSAVTVDNKVNSTVNQSVNQGSGAGAVDKGVNTTKTLSYAEYKSKYSACSVGDSKIVLTEDQLSESSTGIEKLSDYEGYKGTSVKSNEHSSISWNFNVASDGLYQIMIDYFPLKGRGATIEREIYINDSLPFDCATHIDFDRVYKNDSEIQKDNRGNDLRPTQVENPIWCSTMIKHYLGYEKDPLIFKFSAGNNKLTLNGVNEDLILGKITLIPAVKEKSYSEVLKEYESAGYKKLSNKCIKIEGEDAIYKSDATLYPVDDHTSPLTSPNRLGKICINTIGGTTWKSAGQKITWSFHVNNSGLYHINLKNRQNQVNGGCVYRRMYLDNKILFEEMNSIKFDYKNSWRNTVLSDDEGNPYWFYLSEGDHILSLEVTLADMASVVSDTEKAMIDINKIYRHILVITGSSPDENADYNLDKIIPEDISELKIQSDKLYSLVDRIVKMSGKKGNNSAILENIAYQMKQFYEDPDLIPVRFSSFKDNITALGSWILTACEQPLELDYICIYGDDYQLPKADSNFFRKFIYECQIFALSFTQDYSSIGNVTDSGESITAWVSTGRDQAQVIKGLIDQSFTKDTGIGVNLSLVQVGALLSAVVAGINPDVALQVAETEPMNYAMRDAVVKLSDFKDFSEIKGRFNPQSLVPFTYEKGVYGLPETTSFPVMFYRKDILQELDIDVPQTWDDVLKILPVLQKNNLNFFMPVSTSTVAGIGPNWFFTLLYQNGESIYSDDATYSTIDSEAGVSAFQFWTGLYTNYNLPVVADFSNRFRTGEIPIGIADYSTYNMISVFAPEIRGLWAFTGIPGVRNSDGTINRTVATSGLSCMILKNTKHVESSWKLLKWWTSDFAQLGYGRQMESLMGAAARYATANEKALSELPWSSSEYAILSEQWKNLKGIPQVPGSYFTTRHMDNAFRAIINNGSDPRETLNSYTKVINNEITTKREEFGLSIAENKMSKK